MESSGPAMKPSSDIVTCQITPPSDCGPFIRPDRILKQMLEQRDSLDRVFRALADPSRRAMVEQLGRGPMSVSQLAKPLAMTLAGVVQHVQVLETGGIVRSEKRGRV